MTHLKRQKLISSTQVGGYNTQFLLYPRPFELMKLIFAVLDVSLTMGLTGCYKTEGFCIYICSFCTYFTLFLLDTIV